MFKQLRRRLTAVCALGTVLVLVAMAAISLWLPLRQLAVQEEETFRGNVNAVLYYLQGQTVVDQTWLLQTEADGGMLIRIEKDGKPLQYVGLDERREGLTRLAQEQGAGVEPEKQLSYGRDIRLFDFTGGGERFRAAVCRVPFGEGHLQVTVLKSRASEEATGWSLVAGFGTCVALGALALTAFAWFFTGRALRPAEVAAQKQTEFLSAASHELRSPLAVIRLSAGTIKEIPEQAEACADKIEAECQRTSRLVADLLVLAGADSGWDLQPAAASPKTLLLTAAERFEVLAAQKGVTLELEVGEAEPLHCDAGRVEQVLAIFLDNATRYTPEGGTIRLGVYRRRGGVCFSVSDSGPGIPDADKERVFERFYRADAARSGKEHYGLGLSVATEIARLHGGKIEVRDAALGGAEFILWLPFRQGQRETPVKPVVQ